MFADYGGVLFVMLGAMHCAMYGAVHSMRGAMNMNSAMHGAMYVSAIHPPGRTRVRAPSRKYRSPCKRKNHNYRSDQFLHYLFLSMFIR
jgi:hypothetical protein